MVKTPEGAFFPSTVHRLGNTHQSYEKLLGDRSLVVQAKARGVEPVLEPVEHSVWNRSCSGVTSEAGIYFPEPESEPHHSSQDQNWSRQDVLLRAGAPAAADIFPDYRGGA